MGWIVHIKVLGKVWCCLLLSSGHKRGVSFPCNQTLALNKSGLSVGSSAHDEQQPKKKNWIKTVNDFIKIQVGMMP